MLPRTYQAPLLIQTLVSIADILFWLIVPQHPVGHLKPDPQPPGTCNRRKRERCIASHCGKILGAVALRVQVRSINVACVRDHIDDR